MKINKHKLELAMADKCYSATSLGRAAGLSQSTVCKVIIGTGKAMPQTVGKIARALGVRAEDIVEMED